MTTKPIVALESTVITHGLPRPRNLELAEGMEKTVRDNGATPATIAVLHGKVRIGLTKAELHELASLDNPRKVSRRDIPSAIVKQESGGTTVAGTLFAANQAGIKVFATGGIGGVHDLDTLDISTDLQALAETPMVVVCAGAKAILDLPKTLEYLETMSVPVVGYNTDEFPAFYSRRSGLPVSTSFSTPEEIVTFAKTCWKLGMHSAVLVCQPLPEKDNIPKEEIDTIIQECRKEARSQGVSGQALTPFLLSRLADLTHGESLRANISLLYNNAQLAARLAVLFTMSSMENRT